MDKPSLVGSYVGLSVPMMMGLVLLLVVVWAGASPAENGALALRAEPASSLVAPRIDHLAGGAQ